MAAEQTPKSGVRAPATAVERAFERKVRLGKWALLFEQMWPRAWLVLGLAGLFVGASLAGLWPQACRNCRTRSFWPCSGWPLL